MPEIYRPKRRKTNRPKTGKPKEIAKLYNSTRWVKLRNGYLMQNPLCERCLKEDRVTAAQEVHHIKPISTGKDDVEMMGLAYDPGNLMALCKECHHLIHNEMKGITPKNPQNPNNRCKQ